MKYIFPFFLFLVVSAVHAQTKPDSVYAAVEQMPQAGYDITEYIGKNLRYPDSAGMHGVQGRVIVRFVVNKDGSIDSCSVKRGIGGGCDEEAARVLSAMPPWQPGMRNGQPVRVSFSMPVKFAIDTAAAVTKADTVAVPEVVKVETEPMIKNIDSIIIADSLFALTLDKPTSDGLAPGSEYRAVKMRYPEEALANEVEAVVVVRFRINENGIMDRCTILRGKGYGFDMEVKRVLSLIPRWKPSTINGKRVAVYHTQRFPFKLN